MAVLSSTEIFSTKEEAEEKTKAAQEIPRGPGFVDNPGRSSDNNDNCPAHGIRMDWGRPNGERMKEIMLDLLKVKPSLLDVGSRPIQVPSFHWIYHIEWEKYAAQ